MGYMLALFLAAVGSTALALLSNEVWAWIPSLNKHLVRRAARRFKDPALRERYEEEWQAAIADIPGPLTAFAHALSLGRSAERAEQAWRDETTRTDIETNLAHLRVKVEQFAAAMLAARTRAGVTLRDLSGITNIDERTLEALEKGDLLRIPFGRSLFRYLDDPEVRRLLGADFDRLDKQFRDLYRSVNGGLPPAWAPKADERKGVGCVGSHMLERRFIHVSGSQFHWHYVECQLCGEASTMRSELCTGIKVRRKLEADRPAREVYTCELDCHVGLWPWPVSLSLKDYS
jgi:transcriptional regulator with XRE-family HTH domain